MFKLDDNLLIELGLGTLAATEKNRMLNHIYETLEMRVGMKLAQKMTNEQLDEFEAFIDRNDEAGALKWLETNFPDYKQVVADELETLKNEIKTAAPQIMAASQQQAATQPQQSTQVAQPAYQQPVQAQPIAPNAPQPAPYQPVQAQPQQTPQYPSAPQPYPQTPPATAQPQYPQPPIPPTDNNQYDAQQQRSSY